MLEMVEKGLNKEGILMMLNEKTEAESPPRLVGGIVTRWLT